MIVRPASFPADVDAVRGLFRAYAASLGFDLDFQDFEAELAGLPGKYAAPAGRVLLADQDGSAVGCAALRPLEPGVCELKRLYIDPAGRGSGAGRALTSALIEVARDQGYSTLRLDTVESMTPAIALYRSLGFTVIDACCYNPRPDALFFELVLSNRA